MGNAASARHDYAVEVPSRHDNDTNKFSPTYRAGTHANELVRNLNDRASECCWDLFQHTVDTFPNSEFIGRRKYQTNGSLGPFEWITYSQARELALKFGTAIMNNGMIPEDNFPEESLKEAQSLRLIGLFCKNRVEWFLAEQAANAYGLTLVPLYDTLGEESMEFILRQTRMSVAMVSAECLPTLLSASRDVPSFRHVVLLDPLGDIKLPPTITGWHWNDLLDSVTRPLPPTRPSFNAIATLCYTSGTTGVPKGVVLTQGNIVSCVSATLRGPLAPNQSCPVTNTDIHISYLPLAHVFERLVCSFVYTVGGRIGVYSGDVTKLLEDVGVLQPTVFISVPRLFNRISDRVSAGLIDKSTVTQTLFKQGLSSKVSAMRTDAKTSSILWDTLVFSKTRSLMGPNLRLMICGGAPLDQLVAEKMQAFFCAPLIQGYGMTETFGPCFLSDAKDPVLGHVGGPYPSVEFRLESVPEMNYLVTNDPPSGELLLRGYSITKGYFLNKSETAKSIDAEGWLHTGDIAAILPHKGLKIIDRKKNIFKLGQGEYVAPEKVENVYCQVLLVAQIFVFGYSQKNNVVGIVVPEVPIAKKWAVENKLGHLVFEDLCRESKLKDAIMTEMEVVGRTLKGFERVVDIFVTPEQFTVDNGLMTPTSKIKRHEAKLAFQKEIDEMYAKRDD